jgi:hypothetical protein
MGWEECWYDYSMVTLLMDSTAIVHSSTHKYQAQNEERGDHTIGEQQKYKEASDAKTEGCDQRTFKHRSK